MRIELFPSLAEVFSLPSSLDLDLSRYEAHKREDQDVSSCQLHLSAPEFFASWAPYLREYISNVGYREADWDLQLVKSWWVDMGMSKKINFIDTHNHVDVHFTSVYYHTIDDTEPGLLFKRPADVNNLNGALESEGNDSRYSSDFMKFSPKQGDLLVFPSNLFHFTEAIESSNRRSVVADFILTHREVKGRTAGLPPIWTWQTL
jgi:hypothetical protein